MVPTLFLPLSERRRLSRFGAERLTLYINVSLLSLAVTNERQGFIFYLGGGAYHVSLVNSLTLCGVALIFVGADAHISPIDHREGFCGNIMQP